MVLAVVCSDKHDYNFVHCPLLWIFSNILRMEIIIVFRYKGSTEVVKQRVNQSHYRPEVPGGFQEVKVSRLHDSVPGWWQSCQPYTVATFYPSANTPGTHYCTDTIWNQTSDLQFVAQHLNHGATMVPPTEVGPLKTASFHHRTQQRRNHFNQKYKQNHLPELLCLKNAQDIENCSE